MPYKNKLYVLLSIIGVLVLLFLFSFIFNSESAGKRSASFVWIEEKLVSRINKIDIRSQGGIIELINKDRNWYAVVDETEYPARNLRIEDFIAVFSKRGSWPLRSSNASTHASFGLEENYADRITFHGTNSVLLDVLIGYDNVLGNEISIRRAENSEVRSGDNRVKTYITSPVSSWYDLKLFPEENGRIWSADSVQALTVINEGHKQEISRTNRTWTVTNVANPDKSSVEEYIRTILNTEGDNFEGLLQNNENQFNHSRIIVEFGNGKIVTVNFTEPDENGKRLAFADTGDYIYSIPAWSGNRLFRDAAAFESQ